MFEYVTVCLLYLLGCTFEELHVFKPGSSKSGNSEVYVICLRYKGIQIIEHIWDQLIRPYKSFSCENGLAMFTIDQINAELISQVKICADFFMQKQIHTINCNIEHFRKSSAFESVKTKEIRFEVANYYLRRYEVIRIPPQKKIMQINDINKFSFFHKQMFYKKEWLYQENYKEFDTKILDSIDISNLLEIETGKRIDQVFYSNFCCKDYLSNLDSAVCTHFDPKLNDMALHYTDQIDGDHTIVNTKNCDKYLKQYEFQKYLFYELKLQLMKNKIIFLKIPFLTCFLVELLYLLMMNFEKAIFHKKGFVVLHTKNLINFEEVQKCFEKISCVYEKITTKDTSDIIQIFPLDYVLHSEFIELIWNYNNAVCQSM